MLRRFGSRVIFKCSQYNYNAASLSVAASNITKTDKREPASEDISTVDQSKLVAAAFASLKDISSKSKSPPSVSIEKEIATAETIDSLLFVAEKPYLSKVHALQVIFIFIL